VWCPGNAETFHILTVSVVWCLLVVIPVNEKPLSVEIDVGLWTVPCYSYGCILYGCQRVTLTWTCTVKVVAHLLDGTVQVKIQVYGHIYNSLGIAHLGRNKFILQTAILCTWSVVILIILVYLHLMTYQDQFKPNLVIRWVEMQAIWRWWIMLKLVLAQLTHSQSTSPWILGQILVSGNNLAWFFPWKGG